MNILKKEIIKLWEQNIDKPIYNTLYIDIPFCKQYCNYCVHKKVNNYSADNMNEYLNLLNSEMNYFYRIFKNKKISSLLIGGGSPSMLTPEQILRLHDFITSKFIIDVNENSTRTIEFNPNDLTKEKIFAALKNTLFNRVTLGVQSLSKEVVISENREYLSPNRLSKLIEYMKEANNEININIDLMIGLKNETINTIVDTFNFLMNLKINRISLFINSKIIRTNKFILFVKEVLKNLNYTGYEMKGMDGNPNVEIKECYLFFNKNKQNLYDYLYSLGPLMSNRIGFGPLAESQIYNLKLSYSRDNNLNFEKSKYSYEYINTLIDNEIINDIFKVGNKFRF